MSTQCLLLDKMPAEIRNRIYEYAFAPDDDKEVELADGTPPTIDLVLANRQIHNESIGLYALAHLDYFRNTNFCISRERGPFIKPTIHSSLWTSAVVGNTPAYRGKGSVPRCGSSR
ncbi:hypothetical protein M409DRAFT_54536 [Zasmidium cellare ATCC 36951]|uniref:Uncharacterized protein n=1 Tax=Zasmidium cellare ATCC 36951 TaxID=1080233 RepID=A0A6A6CHL6_ZASCE|nr:uncharacterized protein M409DRAFT_54536 [Zasmidium cellare ATCC 36951]KAF2166747.1 hypothetical protein M409DRAFT_54536 [Zasmidium cellare ATCC 36951]